MTTARNHPLRFLGSFSAWLTSRLLTLLRNHVPVHLSREEIRYARINFSQFGEDMAIERWIERRRPDSHIYVDAGCFHPIHCSNTLLLHKSGWKGVNIDMDRNKIINFHSLRPLDHNVVAALSNVAGEKRMFQYEGGGTDRLGDDSEEKMKSAIGEDPLSSILVHTETLNSVLATVPFAIPSIGYLNIDCEGHDLSVLEGLSLERYKPAIITIEALSDQERIKVFEYLLARGYSHKESIYRTLVFVRD